MKNRLLIIPSLFFFGAFSQANAANLTNGQSGISTGTGGAIIISSSASGSSAGSGGTGGHSSQSNDNSGNQKSGMGSTGSDGGKVDGGDPMFDFKTTYDPVKRKITVVDILNKAEVINTAGNSKVYDTSYDFRNGEVPLEPKSINVTPVHNGYDVELQFENTASTPKRIGTMWVSNMPFVGDTAYFRDFSYLQRGDNEYAAKQNSDGYWTYFGRVYPGPAYSPAMVARGKVLQPNGKQAEYAVGVTLQYPVLDYKHLTFISIRSEARKWKIGFYPNPKWRETTGPCGPTDPSCDGKLSDFYNAAYDLPPYDAANPNANKRTYKYSVRIMRNPSQYPALPAAWLRLLEPYREFFQKTYGAPRYVADRRPVQGVMLAISSRINADSPLGFAPPRPDINGWQPVVADMDRQRVQNGWPRQMIWLPSGMSQNLAKNFPYEFTSHWKFIPPMDQTSNLIADYAKSTQDVGLWWGRSTEVMWDWNSSYYELFDQHKVSHRQRAFEELDGARSVNATMIGLDQYVLKGYAGYAWMEEMKMRYPEMTFIGESFQSDIIHLLSPNFKLVGINPEATDRTQCTDGRPRIRPLALPEFLLPGNETWGFSWISWVNDNACGGTPNWFQNTPALAYWPQYMASQGYTPVLLMSPGATQTVDTKTVLQKSIPGYKRVVPIDLQIPYFPQLTKQPDSVQAACDSTIKLTSAARSPRGKSLSYQWFFHKRSDSPATEALPADVARDLMSPVQEGGNYTGAYGNELSVKVKADTIGTYRLLVTEADGGPTWSRYVAVNGDCSAASF